MKNYALPNASWCPDMLNLYHKFLEKTKADGWIRLPSFKSNRNHIQGLKLPLVLTVSSGKAWAQRAHWHTCTPAHQGQISQPPSLWSESLKKEIHKLCASSRPEVFSANSAPPAAAPGRWMRKASSQAPGSPPPRGREHTLAATSAPSPECTHWRTADSAPCPAAFSPGLLPLLSSLIPSPPAHPTKV